MSLSLRRLIHVRQEAGYDPDISRGLRRLADPDEEEEAAPPQGTGASTEPRAEKAPETAPPPPPRYGVVVREVLIAACDASAPAPNAPAACEPHGDEAVAVPSGASSLLVRAVLRHVFPRDHPGVGAMCAWLEEDGVSTAAQLHQLLAPPPGGGGTGGAAALRALGFRPEWAAATAAGFARALAAAEKAAAAP